MIARLRHPHIASIHECGEEVRRPLLRDGSRRRNQPGPACSTREPLAGTGGERAGWVAPAGSPGGRGARLCARRGRACTATSNRPTSCSIRSGALWLTDFGLAKLLDDAPADRHGRMAGHPSLPCSRMPPGGVQRPERCVQPWADPLRDARGRPGLSRNRPGQLDPANLRIRTRPALKKRDPTIPARSGNDRPEGLRPGTGRPLCDGQRAGRGSPALPRRPDDPRVVAPVRSEDRAAGSVVNPAVAALAATIVVLAVAMSILDRAVSRSRPSRTADAGRGTGFIRGLTRRPRAASGMDRPGALAFVTHPPEQGAVGAEAVA